MARKVGRYFSRRFYFWLIFPTMLLLVGLFIFPLFWSMGLSFYEYSALRPYAPVFLAFNNFVELLVDPYFWHRFQTTMLLVVIAVGLEFIIGFVIAFLAYDEFRGKRFFLTLLFAPMMMAPIAVGAFFKFIYEPTFGILNYFIGLLGVNPVGWLTNPKVSLFSIALVDIWMWSPFMMMLALAGLMAVPRYLQEAADIDRAGWFLRFRYVILPQIKPLLILALLLRTMETFRLFDTIFIMTGGGPGLSTETISISLYRIAFQHFHTGKASALAYIMLTVVIVLSNLYLRLAMRRQAGR